MLTQLLIAFVTFAITNTDDLLILSVYFASGRYKTSSIIAGQFAGIIALIVISFVGLIIKEIASAHVVSLLGLLPLALGIKDLWQFRKQNDTDEEISSPKKTHAEWVSVAVVTIANGGDNIGVYAPLFANVKWHNVVIYVSSFLVLTGVWCLLASWLVRHPWVKNVFSRYGKIILPLFLIFLGAAILRSFVAWLLV